MKAYDAYKLWLALYQHFNTETYNYFLYQGKIKTSPQTFMQRNDKYNFYKLVKKYTDLEGFYLANLVYDEPHWSGDLMTNKADKNYKNWLKNNNAITKIFIDDMVVIKDKGPDIEAVSNGQNPILLTMVYQNDITLETLLILDEIDPFLATWNKMLVDTIIWPKFYQKCLKYKPWIQKLDIKKFKEIIK